MEHRDARMLRRRGESLIADDGITESNNDRGNEPQVSDVAVPSLTSPTNQSSVAAVGEGVECDLDSQFGFSLSDDESVTTSRHVV